MSGLNRSELQRGSAKRVLLPTPALSSFFFFFKQNFSFLQEEGGKDLRIVKRAEEEQR